MKLKILYLLATAMLLTACAGAPSPTEPGTQAATSATTPAPAQPAFQEIVLVDDENVTFKVTDIDEDNTWGYTLKVFLENKTGKELMFSLDRTSVNGYMCDPFWAVTVSPGMKANEEISFSHSDFELIGIDEVTDISFTAHIYDSSDWSAAKLVDDEFTIHPLGPDAVWPLERKPLDGEIVLFDNDDCAMIVTGFDPNHIHGYAMEVYLENKTDDDLMFSIDGASVNGFMCDPYWAETVAAGKRSVTAITWSESDFESNGITAVESLSLPVTVYDADDWMEDRIIDETFTVNP